MTGGNDSRRLIRSLGLMLVDARCCECGDAARLPARVVRLPVSYNGRRDGCLPTSRAFYHSSCGAGDEAHACSERSRRV